MWEKIEKALDFITKTSPEKASVANRYTHKNCNNASEEIEVIFPVAFALHALGLVPKSKLTEAEKKWIKKAVIYIEKQEKNFSFNYWVRKIKSSEKYPLPDDLDDTAFCLSALFKHNIEISEKYFFKILKLEKDEGGPYRTWYLREDFTDKQNKKWMDIDPIVNANLYYFVRLYGIDLVNTRKYLIDCLKNSRFSSPYYPYDLFFIYSLSKASGFKNDKEIRNQILKKLDSYKFDTLEPMEKLLYNLSLAHLGKTVDGKLLQNILDLQQEDGSLQPLPFCYDGSLVQTQTYVSNSVITTALFLELLLLIYSARKRSSKPSLIDELNKSQKEIIEDELGELLKVKRFQKILLNKSFHTPLGTPFATAINLKPNLNKKDLEIITDLSVAIHFSWSGYTIDDEILDNQRAVSDIPVSNSLKRVGWKYYYKIIKKHPRFEEPLLKAFKICDENYVWEIQNVKFNRSNLKKVLKMKFGIDYIERRMQPYLVSMKYIPMLLGVDENKSKYVYDFYRSQIIIKQLDDDSHDWKEDDEAGIMTYVLYLLYKENISNKFHNEIFWNKVIYRISEICEREYKLANLALRRINTEYEFMKKLLDKTYYPILKAKEEKEKAVRIITGVRNLENIDDSSLL